MQYMNKFYNDLKASIFIARFILKIHLCSFSYSPSVYGVDFKAIANAESKFTFGAFIIVFHAPVRLRFGKHLIRSNCLSVSKHTSHVRNTLPFLLFSGTGIFLRKCLFSVNLSDFLTKELFSESFRLSNKRISESFNESLLFQKNYLLICQLQKHENLFEYSYVLHLSFSSVLSIKNESIRSPCKYFTF